MALNEALRKKRQEEQKAGINHHPEIDAKIDQFIKENPEVYDKINAYTKEELVRKRILDIVNDNQRRQGYSAEVREYVENNPTVKQEVERRLKRIPEEQRETAFVRIARNVIANIGMRQAPAFQPY
jgi:uncharacterized membrane protein YheB (UPF0754 family)